MILLSMPVMEEISRFLDYGWEWRTICKVINFKHCHNFEIFEMEELYLNSLEKYNEYKSQQEERKEFKTLWLKSK